MFSPRVLLWLMTLCKSQSWLAVSCCLKLTQKCNGLFWGVNSTISKYRNKPMLTTDSVYFTERNWPFLDRESWSAKHH